MDRDELTNKRVHAIARAHDCTIDDVHAALDRHPIGREFRPRRPAHPDPSELMAITTGPDAADLVKLVAVGAAPGTAEDRNRQARVRKDVADVLERRDARQSRARRDHP